MSCSGLCTGSSLSPQPWGPILEVRTRRLRKAQSFRPRHWAVGGRRRGLIPGSPNSRRQLSFPTPPSMTKSL